MCYSYAMIIWELELEALFRIDDSWYRLKKLDGDNGVLDVVGSKETTKLPLETEISELSVLSKK